MPIDVLWFRLPRRPTDAPQSFGRLAAGHLLVLLDRGVYWQIAYLIPKAAADELHQAGLGRLRALVAELVPFLADRVASWGAGRTCARCGCRWTGCGAGSGRGCCASATPLTPCRRLVGSASTWPSMTRGRRHLLVGPLRDGTLSTRHLARVQLRRLLPTVVVQWGQRTIQALPVPAAGRPGAAKGRWSCGPCAATGPAGRPARLVGIGVLPEHVRTRRRRRAAPAPVAQAGRRTGPLCSRAPGPARPGPSWSGPAGPAAWRY